MRSPTSDLWSLTCKRLLWGPPSFEGRGPQWVKGSDVMFKYSCSFKPQQRTVYKVLPCACTVLPVPPPWGLLHIRPSDSPLKTKVGSWGPVQVIIWFVSSQDVTERGRAVLGTSNRYVWMMCMLWSRCHVHALCSLVSHLPRLNVPWQGEGCSLPFHSKLTARFTNAHGWYIGVASNQYHTRSFLLNICYSC